MKTYATLGPACCRADLLTELLDMGLTGFRLNLSHTTLTACRPWTEAVQQARQASGRDAELIVDMRGPELRMGPLSRPVTLTAGETVTLGPGVDAQIRRAGVGDIAAGVASDALGSALAEQTADAAEAELRQLAAAEGTYLTGRFSPGYGDWDIAVQPLVAAALDTARRAGLCVTDTNLMTPRKSVTAILGVSDHPVKGHLAGCGHCVLRTRCEYRKRGKTCASE